MAEQQQLASNSPSQPSPSQPSPSQPASKKEQPAAERSRSELAAKPNGAVVVDIYDQVYQLSGTDRAHIERLASLVDARMRAISAHGATVDSLRVAVLAALNIADEMLSTQARHDSLAATINHASSSVDASVQARTGSLMNMLDDVLQDRKVG